MTVDDEPTVEQRSTMRRVCIAALAEIGIRAWPDPHNERLVLVGNGQPPCEIGYRAMRLAAEAAGWDPRTFELARQADPCGLLRMQRNGRAVMSAEVQR